MASDLTIIMYHYVRDLARSRYPQINGLSVSDFRRQIAFVQERYTVVSGEHLIAAATDCADLPAHAALLTFDDGYLDHFRNVFPILDRMDLPGCFFPPAAAVRDRKVLDVNKIHSLLAAPESDVSQIQDWIFQLMDEWGGEYDLCSPDHYREIVSGEHRFDDPEVVLIKRLLQRELPRSLRRRILDRLFDLYVDVSEEVLARELYMTMEQVRCLRRHGMYVGSHGSRHAWMDRLDPAAQRADVADSLGFLEQVGAPTNRWMMCYPYGAHNASLRAVVREKGGVVGLATGGQKADIESDDPLALPRVDTNDVPVTAPAGPSEF
jgi:peptidoglycan/xylan/chitin deacetylase (PgdA/CDA1 family)